MSDIELIRLLISRNEKTEAAPKTQRHGKHFQFVLGIGVDHVAYLTMTDEAHEELIKTVNRI